MINLSFPLSSPSSPKVSPLLPLSAAPQVLKKKQVDPQSLKRKLDFSLSDTPLPKRPMAMRDRHIAKTNGKAVAVYHIPEPRSLHGTNERVYRAVLAKEIFGSLSDPHSESVFRKCSSATAFEPPPKMPQSEDYSAHPNCMLNTTEIKVLDLSTICEGLRIIPVAYNDDVIAMIGSYSDSTDPLTGSFCAGARIHVWLPGESGPVKMIPSKNDLIGENKPISFAIAPEGELLVFAKENGGIEGWELTDKDPEKLFELKTLEGSKIVSLGLSIHCIFAGDHQGRLHQIDRQKKDLIHTFKDHEKCITKIILSPDGKYLATAGLDQQIVIYHAATMKKLHCVQVKGEIKGMVFAPKEKPQIAIAVGGSESRLCMVHFPPNEMRMIEFPVEAQISSVQWPMAQRMITTHGDSSFRVVPVDARKKYPFGSPRRFFSLALGNGNNENVNFSAVIRSKDPKFLICGATERSIGAIALPDDEKPKNDPLPLNQAIPLIR